MNELDIDMRKLADEIDKFRLKHGGYVTVCYPFESDYFAAMVTVSKDNKKFYSVSKLQSGEYHKSGGL